MKNNQAKVSVETAKEVQNDATLKTKADKDRRLREKNQANTKRFMDERKNIAIKQNKRKDKQKRLHDTQMEEISKDIKAWIQTYTNEEKEQTLAGRREVYV